MTGDQWTGVWNVYTLIIRDIINYDLICNDINDNMIVSILYDSMIILS